MKAFRLVSHAPGAPGLRWLGLGPRLRPMKGLFQLQLLLNEHTSWAKNRSLKDLRKMLRGSQSVVSVWSNEQLIGFGRATSDGTFRGTLWDIVVNDNYHRKGIGSAIVEALVNTAALKEAEKIYLMTTKSTEFYQKLNFTEPEQKLLHRAHADKKKRS